MLENEFEKCKWSDHLLLIYPRLELSLTFYFAEQSSLLSYHLILNNLGFQDFAFIRLRIHNRSNRPPRYRPIRLGAVHKVRHARGGEGSEKVTVCDRGRGSRACDVTLIIFLSYI